MNNAINLINIFLISFLSMAVLSGCNRSDKIEEPVTLSSTISVTGITDLSGNPTRNSDFQDAIMPPNQERILLAQENNPDANNVAFSDTTATLWKFYLER